MSIKESLGITAGRNYGPTDVPQWVLSLLGVVLTISFWEYAVANNLLNTVLFPAPTEIVTEFVRVYDLLFTHLLVTLFEGILGFVAAVVLAIAIAIPITMSQHLREMLMPFIVGGNSIPRVTFAPIIIFYLGGGSLAKYVIAAWIAFFPMLISTVEGLELDDEGRQQMLRLYDATSWQELRYVRFPNALPHIFDGMKLAVNLAFIGAILGEFVAAQEGLGYLLLFAIENIQYALGFAIVLIMGFVGLTAVISLFAIQDRIVFWREATLIQGDR